MRIFIRMVGMPNPSNEHVQRRDTIRELLGRGPVATQQTLVEELGKRGFSATQSSVSRDLRELGAVKTTLGYEMPATNGDAGRDLEVRIFGVDGRLVRRLQARTSRLQWDGRDRHGRLAPNGVYLVRTYSHDTPVTQGTKIIRSR